MGQSGRLPKVRGYHFIDNQSIIRNGIRLNDKVYNAVRISDPDKNGQGYVIKANNNIPPNHIRMLDVTDQINDPKMNVIDQSPSGATCSWPTRRASGARSWARCTAANWCWHPENEPMDVLLVIDPSTGMMA